MYERGYSYAPAGIWTVTKNLYKYQAPWLAFKQDNKRVHQTDFDYGIMIDVSFSKENPIGIFTPMFEECEAPIPIGVARGFILVAGTAEHLSLANGPFQKVVTKGGEFFDTLRLCNSTRASLLVLNPDGSAFYRPLYIPPQPKQPPTYEPLTKPEPLDVNLTPHKRLGRPISEGQCSETPDKDRQL